MLYYFIKYEPIDYLPGKRVIRDFISTDEIQLSHYVDKYYHFYNSESGLSFLVDD